MVVNMHAMLMIMLWDMNACLIHRGVTALKRFGAKEGIAPTRSHLSVQKLGGGPIPDDHGDGGLEHGRDPCLCRGRQ
jgi:hypothetical protein